jgi:hypothetical protein
MLQKDKKGNVLKNKEGKPIPLSSHTLVPVRIEFCNSTRHKSRGHVVSTTRQAS